MNNKLIHGDCLEVMKDIPDNSIDAIITDPPYGTTACKQDSVIPFDLMWEQLNRIIKDNGAICLFGSEPFSSALRMSNIKQYKYEWKWLKNKPTGFQHAPNRPMMKQEDICVFSPAPMGHVSQLKHKRMCYFPQGVKIKGENIITGKTHGKYLGVRKNQIGKKYVAKTGYPNNLLFYDKETHYNHPTQNPVDLIEYLIKTYTNEGEIVLDFTSGSGTTAIAAINTNRNYICIEKDKEYYELSKKRIEEHVNEKQLSLS